MPKTACYICNYNGKEYIENCIKSILEQIEINESFHLYMVDNASTDGSVEWVTVSFGSDVRIIQNAKNLGGAGGFNTALNDALEKGYEYVILLDNDIVVEKKCIDNWVKYLDDHLDVGCVGAKIMIMDRPEYIQEFGGQMDFEKYDLKKNYWYELDQGTEDIIESDWVSSCALIARVEAVKHTNLFPEENFLFWDDIEFTYQIKRAGYKVMSLASAKVYHKGKKKPINNTVTMYYGMRNRIKFFSKYEKEEKIERLCEKILGECFQVFFGSASKGFLAANSSRMFAMDDFVHKHYGKVDGAKIYSMDEKEDKIKRITKCRKNIYIKLMGVNTHAEMEAAGALLRRLEEIENIGEVKILLETLNEREKIEQKIIRYCNCNIKFAECADKEGIVFRPCNHFKDVTEDISPVIWVDKYLNCVENSEDFKRVQAFPYLEEMFIQMHYEWLMNGIIAERKR